MSPLEVTGDLTVALKSGGWLRVRVAIDLTKLSQTDRKFVEELIEVVRRYEENPR